MILTKKEEGDSQREEKEGMFLEIHNLKKAMEMERAGQRFFAELIFLLQKGKSVCCLGHPDQESQHC